jgi:hypothetical protein
MTRTVSVNTLYTIVFIFGILVGTIMHGHLSFIDITIAVLSGLIFYLIRVLSIRFMLNRLLVKRNGFKQPFKFTK